MPKYSLWLCPPAASAAASALAAAIAKLSSALGGPRFPPHATLFSPVAADCGDAEALEQTARFAAELRRQLGADVAGIPVEVDCLAAGDTYHQCIFLKESGSEALAAANAAARQHWGAASQPLFVPHVSLVYGNHPADAMPRLLTQAGTVLPDDLAALSYIATDICVISTSGPCEQWREVGRVSIAPKCETNN
ncbi:hypothetical protein H4R19_000103 [Coemansia spiralis]|nr:hypothetical protein H4R19_000103 [Coemansia spiralis]